MLFFLIFSCKKGKENNDLQSSSSDSLSIYLSAVKNNKYSSPERLKFNQKAFSILSNSKNDSLTRSDLYDVALGF